MKSSKRSIELTTVLLLLFVFSCATGKVEKEETIKTPPIKQNKPVLTPIQKPVIKINTETLAEKNKKKRYTLVFRDAPLREVLMTLSRDKGINVVFDETVNSSTPVSLDVRDVTFDQAMKVLSQSYNFSYILDGNILWIYKNRIFTDIFKIKMVNIEREVTVSSSIESGGASSGSSSGSESEGGGGGGGGGSSGGFHVTTQTTTAFNVWKDVGCNVCALLGLDCGSTEEGSAGVAKICSKNGRFVAINKTTGHMIVGGTYSEIEKIREYMDVTESSLNKQVILDVKLIEVTLSRGSNLGVDWNKIMHSHDYIINLSQSSTAEGHLLPIPSFTTFSLTPRPNLKNPINMVIHALESYGKVHVISSPRIAVMNNQAAVIKIGEDMKFVTDVSTETSTTGTATVVGCDVDTETYFTGVALTVTPYIDEKGDVTIYLHPSVSELKEVRMFQSECGDVPIEEPVFDVRELDTVVKVRDGDTLVIGGLIKNYSKENTHETPGVSKMPILGNLFKREEKSKERSELVIFITPKVIYNTTRRTPVTYRGPADMMR